MKDTSKQFSHAQIIYDDRQGQSLTGLLLTTLEQRGVAKGGRIWKPIKHVLRCLLVYWFTLSALGVLRRLMQWIDQQQAQPIWGARAEVEQEGVMLLGKWVVGSGLLLLLFQLDHLPCSPLSSLGKEHRLEALGWRSCSGWLCTACHEWAEESTYALITTVKKGAHSSFAGKQSLSPGSKVPLPSIA